MSVRQLFKSSVEICAQGFFLLVLGGMACSLAAAQEARGNITGIVTDPHGLVVAGAHVVATNVATNVQTATVSNGSGNYALLYLPVGTYSITVEQSGFDKLVQHGVELHVGDELKVDLKLTVGNVKQEVNVNAQGSMIESETANVGVTMNQQQIADLPLSDGNPFTLARLVPGAVFTGSPLYARPFDNGDVSALRVNGAEGQIDFALNGAPNNGHQIGHNDPVISYMPPADAMEEFKMTTSTYSAADGHSAAAHVNVSTKGGGNSIHGSVYAENRNEIFSANDFFANNLRRPKGVTRLNHYGAFISGPVVIPKIYNGHNKTFFSFVTDQMTDSFPSSNSDATVPTLGMRGLDASHNQLPYFDFGSLCQAGFSSIGVCKDLASDGKTVLHQIYDPTTTVRQSPTSTNVTRKPFAFNRIPRTMVNPIALNVINFYPLPNQAGLSDGTHNYFSHNPRSDWFHSYMGRVDHVISDRQKLYGTYQQNWRQESRGNPFGMVTNPLLNVTMAPVGDNLYYINHGAQLDDTVELSPVTVLDVRLGYGRFQDHRRPEVLGFDPTSFGLPAGPSNVVKGYTGAQNFMPFFQINGFNSLGNASSHYEDAITNTYYSSATLNRVMGSHVMSVGYDIRLIRENSNSLGDAMGYYDFRENYAEQTNRSSAEQGQGLATFLLGLPYNNASRIDVNGTSANQRLWHGAFFQDDWKVLPNLTLNLGLRYEYEGAPTERFNRNIVGFDLTAPSAMSAAVQAAFARLYAGGIYSPAPNACGTTTICPISSFSLANQAVGGYLFANSGHRTFYHANPWNFLPRFGVAYSLNSKTVLRGGVGLYSVPLSGAGNNGSPGFNQTGFSQRTTAFSTQNNGLNFNPNNCALTPPPGQGPNCPAGMATLANPFPAGVFLPPGSSLGLETGMGANVNISPLDPRVHPKTGESLAWSFDIQRQLSTNWTVMLNYTGRRGWNLPRSSNYLNAIPRQYYTSDPLNNAFMQAWNAEMTLNVPNPLQGQGPGGPTNGGFNNGQPAATTIPLNQLLRPYPQFDTVTTALYNGTNSYHGGSVMVNHRFTKGYQVYATYTFSKLMEDFGFLNDWETKPLHALSGDDVRHRVTATFIGQVPVGRGRSFGNNMPRWLDATIGGWQTGIVFQAQSGLIPSWSDRYYNGDPTKLRVHLDSRNIAAGGGFDSNGNPINGQVFDVSGFYPSGQSACVGQGGNPATAASGLCSGDPLIKTTFHVRTFPRVLPNFHDPGQNNWDINALKKFPITERVTYELRADFLNAFNHPWFNGPNIDPTKTDFGKITGQRNLPRNVQIGMKVTF